MTEEQLSAFSPLLWIMAREHVDDRNLHEDCVQEALIRVWQVAERQPRASPQYLRACARRRIQEVAKRQTWLGHTGKHGHPTDPLRRAHDSLDAIRGWDDC